MKTIKVGSAFAVLAIALVGCSGTHVLNKGPLQRTEAVQMNEVVFVDHELNKTTQNRLTKTFHQKVRVSVDSKGMRSTATGNAEVWVVLRNHTDHPQQVEGRTMFFDAQKAPVDAAPQWKRVYIPANSLATYKELSISPQVGFYRVEIKGAQ